MPAQFATRSCTYLAMQTARPLTAHAQADSIESRSLWRCIIRTTSPRTFSPFLRCITQVHTVVHLIPLLLPQTHTESHRLGARGDEEQ